MERMQIKRTKRLMLRGGPDVRRFFSIPLHAMPLTCSVSLKIDFEFFKAN